MKKFLLLFLAILCIRLQAQFVNQVVYHGVYTSAQVDSILGTQGLPSGIIPLHFGVKVYKVIYNTVDWDSVPTTASGLLVVPVNVRCNVPFISYQHGTISKKSDAPSQLQNEWFLALAGAAMGNVMAMPDYLGLGESTLFHPYQHAHTEATAVIDMIRASKEILDTVGVQVNDQLFLFGYSQGGHATMAAHQLIQEQLDSEMHVTASAPMSGAYDMSGVMVDLMLSDSTYPQPFYLPYLMFGYNEVYNLFTNDSDVMISPYDTLLRPLFDGTHSGGEINAVMPQVPKHIFQPAQIDSFANDSLNFFRVHLKKGDTYKWVPNSPVRMYFCRSDHSVPYQNSIVAYNYFVQHGATSVDTIDVNPSLDHYPCAQFAILNAMLWFSDIAYHPMRTSVSVVNNTSDNSPNGSATVNALDGTPPFSYLWNTGDTTVSINNLSAGVYIVTVTDQSSCEHIDTATIELVSGLQNEVLTQIKIYPNPSHGNIVVENLNPSDNITEAELFDMNGRTIKVYTVRKGNNLYLYTDEAAAGVYSLRLKSESGKETRKKVVMM